MKTKLIPAVFSALFLSTAMAPVAFAQDVRAGADAQVQVRVQGSDASVTAKADARASATTTRGELSAEEHRSEVATFVRSLLSAADREGGIGEQVRVVARSQEKSASTSAEAVAKVERRGGIVAFLLGSDYKNLGRIRAELATTTANIAKLKRLAEDAQTAEAKAEIEAQIQVLEESQAKVEAFVEAKENAFSVFGWFAKLFVR